MLRNSRSVPSFPEKLLPLSRSIRGPFNQWTPVGPPLSCCQSIPAPNLWMKRSVVLTTLSPQPRKRLKHLSTGRQRAPQPPLPKVLPSDRLLGRLAPPPRNMPLRLRLGPLQGQRAKHLVAVQHQAIGQRMAQPVSSLNLLRPSEVGEAALEPILGSLRRWDL